MAFFNDLKKDFTKLYDGVSASIKKQLDLEEKKDTGQIQVKQSTDEKILKDYFFEAGEKVALFKNDVMKKLNITDEEQKQKELLMRFKKYVEPSINTENKPKNSQEQVLRGYLMKKGTSVFST